MQEKKKCQKNTQHNAMEIKQGMKQEIKQPQQKKQTLAQTLHVQADEGKQFTHTQHKHNRRLRREHAGRFSGRGIFLTRDGP